MEKIEMQPEIIRLVSIGGSITYRIRSVSQRKKDTVLHPGVYKTLRQAKRRLKRFENSVK